MLGIQQPLGNITPASASTDQVLIFEQRRRGDRNITDTTPLTVSEVVVVNAQAISTSSALTLADTLASSTEDGTPLAVELASATLSDAATPGEIVIVGEDADGNNVTVTLTFPAGALTTPQYTEVLWTEITSITPDEFAAGTVTVTALGATSGGEAFPFQPLVNEGDLALTGELIPLEYKTGNATAKKGAPGPLDITNGLVIAATGHAGVLLPLSMVLQNRRFDWHVLNGTGKTYPSDITVVAEVDVVGRTRAATQTLRRTIADSLATSTNPRRVTFTPITPLTVVSAQSISSDGSLTVAEDLDPARSTAVALRVTLASAGLTSTATPGTITITGTDAGGTSRTEILSFANNALTAAQTTTRRWASITSVANAGFNAGTATIREAPLTLTAGQVAGEILVIGTDTADEVAAEVVNVTTSQLAGAVTTDTFFKTVTEIRCANFATGLYAATARDRAVRVTLRPQDEAQLRYWTIEYSKGGVPNVYRDLTATQMTFSIGSRSEAITYAMQFIGGDGDTYQNLAGQVYNDAAIPPYYPKPTERNSALRFTPPDYYTTWQAKLFIDGVLMYITSATFTFEAGIVNGDAISGEQYQAAPPVRDTMRSLMLDLTIQYSRENDFTGLFRKNRTIENVEVHFINNPSGSFRQQQIWTFPEMQSQGFSDPSTSGQSRITTDIQLKAFDNNFGNPNDVRVQVDMSELILPRVF